MTLRQQASAWAIVTLAFGAALYFLSGVLLPFVAALALGYLLDPVASWLERRGLSRLMATLIILLVFALATIALIALIAPLLAHQLASFLDAFPDLFDKAQRALTEKGGAWLTKLRLDIVDLLGGKVDAGGGPQQMAPDLLRTATKWLLGVVKSVLSGGVALINLASLMIVTPVAAFYLLLDWAPMVAALDANIPPRDRPRLRQIAHEIDAALAGFLRGQSLVCAFLGLWYGLGLTLIGVNFGLLIGVVGGVLSFIPYVGSLTVLVLSLIVAIAQGWPSLALPGLALAVVGTGQFLEGNILSPRLVGDSVGLHPVWLMFALMAFGALFGFLGLIVAVPVSAAIGVLVRHALEAYRGSAFFLAGSEPGDRGPTA